MMVMIMHNSSIIIANLIPAEKRLMISVFSIRKVGKVLRGN